MAAPIQYIVTLILFSEIAFGFDVWDYLAVTSFAAAHNYRWSLVSE